MRDQVLETLLQMIHMAMNQATGTSKPEETPSIDDSGNSDATTDQKPDSGDDKDPAPTPDFFAPPTAASIYSGTPRYFLVYGQSVGIRAYNCRSACGS